MKRVSAVTIGIILVLAALSTAHAVTYAQGINNAGTIVGSYEDVNGLIHGFSLNGGTYTTIDYPGSPVPIPSAILLFVPGLLGLVVVRRRFKK